MRCFSHSLFKAFQLEIQLFPHYVYNNGAVSKHFEGLGNIFFDTIPVIFYRTIKGKNISERVTEKV